MEVRNDKILSGQLAKVFFEIDFTDFYPTLAEAAGIKMAKDDPIDGRSFLPQLKGEKGNPRQWVLCYYNCYWNKTPGQFVRTQDFKLYQNGNYYNVPKDLKETSNITKGSKGEKAETVRLQLQQILDKTPKVSTKKEGRDAKQRPTYPDNQRIIEPGD